MDVGQTIKGFLEKKDITQAGLAREIGVSRSLVQQMIGDQRSCTPEIALKIIGALKLSDSEKMEFLNSLFKSDTSLAQLSRVLPDIQFRHTWELPLKKFFLAHIKLSLTIIESKAIFEAPWFGVFDVGGFHQNKKARTFLFLSKQQKPRIYIESLSHKGKAIKVPSQRAGSVDFNNSRLNSQSLKRALFQLRLIPQEIENINIYESGN